MQVTLRNVTRAVFIAFYYPLNAAKPKGDEIIENAAFRKRAKAACGIASAGDGPDIDSLPPDGANLVLEESTFRYLKKTFKAALESGDVFPGQISESVCDADAVIDAASAELKEAQKAAEETSGGNGTEPEGTEKPGKNRLKIKG